MKSNMETRVLRLGAAAIGLAWLFSITGPLSAQQGPSTPTEATKIDFTKGQKLTHLFSTYTRTRFVPPAILTNSQRLGDLIVDGELHMSLADAIRLALENNLEIAVARYNLPIAQTDLLRAKGGGASRGVAGAYQSNTIFSAEIGASVGGGRASGSTGAGGILGGSIPTLGSVGCCDPTVSVFYGWDDASTPLNYTVVSGVSVEGTHSAYLSTSYMQGFLTGTSLYAGVNGYRESSNATTEIYNPDIASNLYVGFSQQLLNGFGYRANAKFIRISQNDLKYSGSVSRQHVVDILSKVISTYYDLLTDLDTIRVSQEELASVKDLLEKQRVEVSARAVATSDLISTQRDVLARQQDLLAAQNTFDQDSQSFKAEICKNFNFALANSRITPTDNLPEPRPDDVPGLAEALQEAAQNRPEIEQAQLNLGNQAITIEAVHNGLLPGLLAYGEYTPSGLAGTLDPSLAGMIHNRYPNYAYGVRLNIPLGNRTAQADAARALLEQRQLEMQLQQAQNQSVWDVSKAVSAVQQAKGQLDATRELTKLARQVVEMDKQKFAFALARVEEVIGAERELATAENTEVRARATYAKALIQFELATGTILERNDVALSDAVGADFTKRNASANPQPVP
jgi:outer membrane protein